MQLHVYSQLRAVKHARLYNVTSLTSLTSLRGQNAARDAWSHACACIGTQARREANWSNTKIPVKREQIGQTLADGLTGQNEHNGQKACWSNINIVVKPHQDTVAGL